MEDDLDVIDGPTVWLGALGGIVGACAPLLYGMQALREFQQPLPPGVGRCGLQVLGTIFFVAVAPPLGAMLVAFAGCCLGCCLKFWRCWRAEDEFDEFEE